MKRQLYFLSMAAAALFVLVFVNILAGLLENRFELRRDLTGQELYTLTWESRDMLGELRHNVDIVVLSSEAEWREDADYRRIAEVLRGYAAASDGRVSVVYRNPDNEPDLASQFDLLPGLYRNDIILKGPYRYTRLSPIDLYGYEYGEDAPAAEAARLNAEGPLLSAFRYVLNPGNIYFLINNQEEHSRATALRAHFEDMGFVCHPLNLSQETLPEDADAVVSMSPRGDYPAQELRQLGAYMESGGFFMVFRAGGGADTPRLDAFLAEWGIQFQPYILCDAQSGGETLRHIKLGANGFGILHYPALSDYAEAASPPWLTEGNPAAPLWKGKERNGRVVRVLLETSEKAWIEKLPGKSGYAAQEDGEDTRDEPDTDIPDARITPEAIEPGDAPYPAAVLSEQSGGGALFAVSASFADDEAGLSETYAAANLPFFTALTRQFAIAPGQPAAPAPKSLRPAPFQISGGQGLGVLMGLVVILPLLVLLTGLFLTRRKKD